MPQAELGVNTYLPTRNDRGELVVLLECEKLNAFVKNFNQTDMLRFSVFLMMRLAQDRDMEKGVIILENLKDYPMTAGMRLQGASYGGMKANWEWLKASPMRLKGIYGCYQPFYIPLMMAMVKPFMSKKLRDRVALFGSDTAAMLAAAGLRPDQVPPEYGGTLEGFDPAWYLRGESNSGGGGGGGGGGGAAAGGAAENPLAAGADAGEGVAAEASAAESPVLDA